MDGIDGEGKDRHTFDLAVMPNVLYCEKGDDSTRQPKNASIWKGIAQQISMRARTWCV